MREIKFRAWEKERGLMYSEWDDDGVVAAMRCPGGGVELGYAILMPYEYTLMQYTGLKDKNGTPIYEGDIVTDGTINRAPVIWDEYRWNVQEYYNASYDYPSEAFSEGMPFTVIGNIWENKELLK